MSNPFEAAIGVLKTVGSHIKSFQSAIVVLEAASAVDERDLGRIHMGFISSEMRALLEAIREAKATTAGAGMGE